MKTNSKLTREQWEEQVEAPLIEEYVKSRYPDSLGFLHELPAGEATDFQHKLSALWINYKLELSPVA